MKLISLIRNELTKMTKKKTFLFYIIILIAYVLVCVCGESAIDEDRKSVV